MIFPIYLFKNRSLFTFVFQIFLHFYMSLTLSSLFAQEVRCSPPCSILQGKAARLHNIHLMHNVLKKNEYTGYDILIISSTTKEEADYQQSLLEKAFAGTSRKDGKTPIILSVIDSTEGGQVIGAIFTWNKAEEKMRKMQPGLILSYGSLIDYIRATRSKTAVYHNGGRGERCSPLTQSLGNSRGSQKLVGSVKNALGENVELDVLLGVVLQCSGFAATNQGTHIDTFWTSQIAFGSYPHDQIVRSNFAVDKFLVGFNKENLIAQNMTDFGSAALSKTGRMVAFYGNKRFASRKGDRYMLEMAKIEKELLNKGDRVAYDFGSFSCSLDMWQLISDYWKKKNIFEIMGAEKGRLKIKRDIDPHFVQPFIRFLYGIEDLANRQIIEQNLPDPALIRTQENLETVRENFNHLLKEIAPQAYEYIWEDVNQEKDLKKKNESATCMNEIMEFYILNRQTPVFKDLKKIFGFIDLGNETQWFRYRRPIDILNEKLEMLTDLIDKKLEVQLNGYVQEDQADEVQIQRSCEARLMRGIKENEIVKFTVEGKVVTMTSSEVKVGKSAEGVYVRNSIIQNCDLIKGSSIINSILNHVSGKVIAYYAYLESSTAPLIEAKNSLIHEVIEINPLVKADREVVSDVYRTKLDSPYHGRMRAPIGYDPKGMPIYKVLGKNGQEVIYSEELDETIQYFIEQIPYDLKNMKEYSDETARTEDGLFTFEEIRRIEPLRIADKNFRESIHAVVKKAICNQHFDK